MTALSVRDLHVTFQSRTRKARGARVVRGVSFELAAGEVLGIVGESGSGKSVTSLAVMGLLPETAKVEGSVRLRDRELLGLGERELAGIRGKEISMIFQDPLSSLTPVYTIGDQLAEAVRTHRRVGRQEARKRSLELLDLVGIPNPAVRARAFPHEFSGGMRQRVMIAMAMANDPEVIIADEPTTALDVTIQAQILDVLKTAREATGAAILMITHDLGVVAGIADRVLVMYAGKPVEVGPVAEIYERPRMPYTVGLLNSIPRLDQGARQALVPIDGAPPVAGALPAGCPFHPRCPVATEACEKSEPELTPVSGRHLAACLRVDEELDVAAHYPHGAAPARVDRSGEPVVLSVDNLVKHFPLLKGAVFKRRVGTVHAVDGVGFELRRGQTLGLVGESGCGKTTTLQQIMELAAPQQGTIVVLGHDTAGQDAATKRAIRANVQIVFQDPIASLDPRMPVSDILAEPLRLYGRPGIPRRIGELLRLVGLDPAMASRYPRHFSGGQRQRIGIARALALEPELLILDEPVSALDVSIQAGIINLLEELRDRLGLSYLFVAHDLAVVRHIADRVAVMYLGRIAEIGAVDEIYDRPAHPYTQALISAVPIPDPVKERRRKRIILQGDLPSPASPPSGCRFHGRCPVYAALPEAERERCATEVPEVRPLNGTDRQVACHFPQTKELL